MAMENKNILVIDDDRDFAMSTKTFLEGRGYAVDTAVNGTEAWEKIQAGKPDLVVLDIMMDYDAEGFNLAYKLRQDDAWRNLPIVIVSGFSQYLTEKMDQFQFVLGQDWPADSYLEKPVNLNELAKTIDRFLPGTEGRTAAA
jgi:CheY-like chemotaxis protein